MQVRIVILLILMTAAETFSQNNSWQKINNPSSVISDFNVISASEINNTLMLGTFSHGLQGSIDQGTTWDQYYNGLTYPAITASFVASNGILFAGARTSLSTQCGRSVFRSTDNGLSWSGVLDVINYDISDFFEDDAGNIYAVTGEKIYRSTDSGNTWYTCLIMDNIFSASWIKEYIFVSCSQELGTKGILVRVNFHTSKRDTVFSYGNGFVADINSDSNGKIYLQTVDGELYFSKDDGAVWQFLYKFGCVFAGEDKYNNLVIDDSNNLYLGSSGDDSNLSGIIKIVFSNDTVFTVQLLTNQGTRCFSILHDIILRVSRNGDRIFLSNKDEINWKEINIVDNSPTFHMVYSKEEGKIILGGCEDINGKAFLSTDNASSWLGIFPIISCQKTDDWTYLLSRDGSIYRSKNGVTCEKIAAYNDYVNAYNGDQVKVSNNGGIFISGHGIKLKKYSEQLNSWEVIYNGSYTICDYCFNSKNDIFMVSNNSYNVFRSTNNGITWEEFFIKSATGGDKKIICLKNDDLLISTGIGVFISTNSGENWYNIFDWYSYNIDSVQDDILLATTSEGVYVSYDRGDQWSLINEGFDYSKPVKIMDIDVDNKGYIYAVLEGEGLYKTMMPIFTSVNENQNICSDYNLFQNYPNPFNPTTTIKYSLPYTSNIRLSVFNMLGEKVSDLLNKVEEAGYYEIEMNAGNLSSGVYIYVLEAKSAYGKSDTYRSIKKMMLIK